MPAALAPLPPSPDTSQVKELQQLTGNEQSLAFWEPERSSRRCTRLSDAAEKAIAQRVPRWEKLGRLLKHAAPLPLAAEVEPQVEAIRESA